jgi:hypothetical protein
MSAAVVPSKSIDQCDLRAMIIRWRIAVEYLEESGIDSLPAEKALRFLIRHDVPTLLKELIRLHPDLT